MRYRELVITVTFALAISVVAPEASAAAAPSPWWQLLTGSRPSNLAPQPGSYEQEITVTPEGGNAAAIVKLEGKPIACLGTGGAGFFVCAFGFSLPVSETASQLQAALEAALGTGTAEVSGGPVGGAPFNVVLPERGLPEIEVTKFFGSVTSKLISFGGSGRLVVTATNLGDAPAEGSSASITVLDELPEGVEATGVAGYAGQNQKPVDCSIEAGDRVVCTYEGALPSFEALEIEVYVNATGPSGGAPGTVTVSGGGTEAVEEQQTVKVSDDPTEFGIDRLAFAAEKEGGKQSNHAGAHPFQFTATVQFNGGKMVPGNHPRGDIEQPAQPRNLRFMLPRGLVGAAAALPTCPLDEFFARPTECSDNTVIGVAAVTAIEKYNLGIFRQPIPVFNLPPAEGEPARFGFLPGEVPVVLDTAADPDSEYRIQVKVTNASQVVSLLSSTVTFWGTPGDSVHDPARGKECLDNAGACAPPGDLAETAFLREPVSCDSPLDYNAEIEPWNVPQGSAIVSSPFASAPLVGCNQVPFDPAISAAPTSKLAGNPSGLDFRLDMPNSGLFEKEAIAEGQAKKVEVTLPEGMSINPSEGEGLIACSAAELARETATSPPGAGCPEASKVGEVQFQTPLLDEEGHGSLYVATPFENPFGSLVALYLVAKIPERGILVKQAGKVSADPATGQLTTTFDDLPELPVSSFKLHFREGGRAPLVTPPACGSYDVVARFTPWSASDPDNPLPEEIVTRTSSFQVERGVDGGACPTGATPPFHPGLSAGTLNNAAGHYSPFNLRLTRNDGEQEFTHFSIKLPPGVSGKLAGIPLCSDGAIAAAKARTGPHGGAEELGNPSCPGASQVGRTLVGAGVGGSLTYVPGKVYLAGPYNGAPISIVSMTAAKVGPFDLGTVVVREALKVNPETAEVFVDAAGSDPIPHIIQGIPVHARDIRVYVDRPDFTLNPTSCEPTSTASTVVGSGLDFGSAADDVPVTVTSRFQAADCQSLGFKPRLAISLLGGTRRGATPRLRAVLRPRKGDANIAAARVTLPHSVFLEQAHIRTVCTRVQFNAGAGNGAGCPKASIYGRARAFSPLLDEPVVGPVYLRSSSHPLPDLVAALHARKIDFNLVGRIDSGKGGRIRNTFEAAPDVPVTKFVLLMQGGKKGLVTNSTNLCAGRKRRAIAAFTGHNGKRRTLHPVVKPRCGRRKASSKRHSGA
jgi:hypothetical protein